MKKFLALVLMALMLMSAGALAEGGFVFVTDGTAEEVSAAGQTGAEIILCRDTMEDGLTAVMMAAYNPDGTLRDTVYLTDYYGDDGVFSLTVYALENGKYFAHGSYTLDTESHIYQLMRLEDVFVIETAYTNPGYSDAFALMESRTGAELFYSDGADGEANAVESIDALLNYALKDNGVTIEEGQVVSVAGKAICTLDNGGVGALPQSEQSYGQVKSDERFASIYTTGDVHVRTSPSLDGESIGVIKMGNVATFLNETAEDDRGVVWYRIDYEGAESAWVSSRYSRLQ